MSKIIFTLCVFLSKSAFAEEISFPVPKAMAVLGDSMSEGMLADYSLEKKPGFADIVNLVWIGSENNETLRINAYRQSFAAKSKSWSGGNDPKDLVVSHFERLRELNHDLVEANFAVSGDESKGLEAQVDQFLQAERSEGIVFDYVTLMIGANDLAQVAVEDLVSPQKYISNVERALRRILSANRDRRIFIVGLPNVHKIFEESKDFSVYKFWYDSLKCDSMRRQVYGPKLMFFPDREEDYRKTKEIVSEYREALGDLVEKLSMEFYSTSFKFLKEYRLPTNIKKALSIDCFHPSEWGQAELAELTWAGSFWPNILPSEFGLWNQR